MAPKQAYVTAEQVAAASCQEVINLVTMFMDNPDYLLGGDDGI